MVERIRKPKPKSRAVVLTPAAPRRETVTHAFDDVVADLAAVRGVTFPTGHCWPPAAEGAPPWPIVVDEEGNWSQIDNG